MSRRDLKLWLEEMYPVILVLYDGQNDRAYWIHIQASFSGRRTAELFAGGETISVYLPAGKRLNRRAIQAIARGKNSLHQQLRGKGPKNV